MKRVGTVLTFAPGVTAEQAKEALTKFVKANPGLVAADWLEDPVNNIAWRSVYFRVNEFEDTQGGPVWYIP